MAQINSEAEKKGGVNFSFTILISIQALKVSNDAHRHWGSQSTY